MYDTKEQNWSRAVIEMEQNDILILDSTVVFASHYSFIMVMRWIEKKIPD